MEINEDTLFFIIEHLFGIPITKEIEGKIKP